MLEEGSQCERDGKACGSCGGGDEKKKEESEELTSEASFMLEDPVVFECMTRCSMTGIEHADAALTHEMSVVMKVRWWELRGMNLEDVKEESRW